MIKEDQGMMKRTLGLKESITLTVGTVVGVGLFTVGANGVGYLGPMVILATLAALLVSIFPALLYAEMGSSLPYAGGTYYYASKGLGRFWGMQAGWNFVISLIAVVSGEALAFSFYFKTIFEALGVNLTIDERIIASLVVLLFIYINWKGVEITGRMQNAFVFFFWGVSIVWFISMFKEINLSYYKPFIIPGQTGIRDFIFTTSLIWWCFAGFESCCAMGEEIKFPQVNIPRAMFLSPFIIFAVNAIFQWFLLGIVPPESLSIIAESSAPYADGMKLAGIIGFPLVLLCAGIAFGGDFSTLNAGIAGPARYLYSMSEDGVLPKIFAGLHPKYKTPHRAILFLGIFILLFIGTGSIIYIASLSLFADLLYYIIGFAGAIGLRKNRPDIERPYKVPALKSGAILSIIIYIIMMTQLPMDAFITGAAWCVIGAVVYKFYTNSDDNTIEEEEIILPDMPTDEEMKELNKEYKLWKILTGIAFIISIAIYFIS